MNHRFMKETQPNFTGVYSSSQKSAEYTSQFPNATSVHTISRLPCSPDSATLIQIRKKTTRQPISRKSQKLPHLPHKILSSVSNWKLIAPIALSFSTYKLETLAINSSFCFVLLSVQLVFETFTYALPTVSTVASYLVSKSKLKVSSSLASLQLDPNAHITHRSTTGSHTLLPPVAYCLSFTLDSKALE